MWIKCIKITNIWCCDGQGWNIWGFSQVSLAGEQRQNGHRDLCSELSHSFNYFKENLSVKMRFFITLILWSKILIYIVPLTSTFSRPNSLLLQTFKKLCLKNFWYLGSCWYFIGKFKYQSISTKRFNFFLLVLKLENFSPHLSKIFLNRTFYSINVLSKIFLIFKMLLQLVL